MASWGRLHYDRLKQLEEAGATKPTDENLEAVDMTASPTWQTFLPEDEARNGFIIQNMANNVLFIRDVGSDATGFMLPSRGDSFSPDFKPEKAYEIRSESEGGNFVLTVW